MITVSNSNFYKAVLLWFSQHGRKDLPWQKDPSPYSVWISEIMLQQTQVKTVIPYYQKFMAAFPSLDSLAQATEDEVLALWSGLGYYSRARNLYKTALLLSESKLIENAQQGFPDTVTQLQSLPGIGRSTAGAIVALAMNKRAAILDGNVKRVLTRCFAIDGWPGKSAINKQLWQLSEQLTPDIQIKDYTQAMMDLGATVCSRTNPDCDSCPLTNMCIANKQGEQNLYPGRKKKSSLPDKHQYFYLLTNDDNQILMEQRPATGVWGGLWAPPAVDKNTDCTDYLLNKYGITTESETPLAEFKHTFSHFHLHLYPVKARIVNRVVDLEICENNLRWDSLDNWLKSGISTAVRKMLLQTKSHSTN